MIGITLYNCLINIFSVLCLFVKELSQLGGGTANTSPARVDRDVREGTNTRSSFPCSLCEQIFTRKSSLKVHRERHHADGTGPVRPFICDLCGKGFSRCFTMRRHQRVHRVEAVVHVTQAPQDNQPLLVAEAPPQIQRSSFKCPKCVKSFTRRDNLRKHRRLRHPNPPTDPEPQHPHPADPEPHQDPPADPDPLQEDPEEFPGNDMEEHGLFPTANQHWRLLRTNHQVGRRVQDT